MEGSLKPVPKEALNAVLSLGLKTTPSLGLKL